MFISTSVDSLNYRSFIFFYSYTQKTVYILGYYDGAFLYLQTSIPTSSFLLTADLTLSATTANFQVPQLTTIDTVCNICIMKYNSGL
jgi:hypothetical protein